MNWPVLGPIAPAEYYTFYQPAFAIPHAEWEMEEEINRRFNALVALYRFDSPTVLGGSCRMAMLKAAGITEAR